MATRIYPGGTRTHPRAMRMYGGFTQYKDMLTIRGTGSSSYSAATAGGLVRQISTSGASANIITWWSERVAADFTISSDIAVNAWANGNAGVTHRIRVTISKITANGSDVETVIGTGDATSDITATATAFSITVPVPTPIAVGAGERLLARFYIFRQDGGTVTGAFLRAGATSSGVTGDTWIDIPGDPTFRNNQTLFSLRTTTTIGIGSFMDLSETFGVSAFSSAIANTVGSGTEIVWTKTAGGTTAEWISPRLKSQWELPDLAYDGVLMAQVILAAKESATNANIATRYKIFARDPAGTETLILTGEPSGAIELTTTMANSGPNALGSTTYTALKTVGEDWRLVFRAYMIPASGLTMGGSQTGTLGYDGPLPISTAGTSSVGFYDLPLLKAEGDPALSPIVPSGQSTTGVSNGQ